MWTLIESKRLSLRLLGVLEMEALLRGERSTAERLLECRITDDALLDRMPLAARLEQVRANPAAQPWLLRAMVDRASRTMIGHIGFHSPPRPQYLAAIAPDGVEMGYTVYVPFRRRGYATEAVLALMHWAYTQHEQRCFVLSISPQNLASTAMAESLGFTPCGSHVDDEDGLEMEFVRRIESWPAEWCSARAGSPPVAVDRSGARRSL
jgi:RimJ/RimL family protein N-acetyltransferase